MENIINDYDKTILSVGAIAGLLLLVLLYLVFKYKNDLKNANILLEEKEDKITWFRQIEAENERKRIDLAHTVALETQALQNSIDTLEKEAKEGTKNQVVTMIKAQQNKRARVLQQAGISEES